MAARRAVSAGQKLKRELSKPGDPFRLTILIDRAAHTADWLEKCTDLVNGKRSSWLQVRVNRDQVIEVRLDNAIRDARLLTTELRQLLAEISKQRTSLGGSGGSSGGSAKDPLASF